MPVTQSSVSKEKKRKSKPASLFMLFRTFVQNPMENVYKLSHAPLGPTNYDYMDQLEASINVHFEHFNETLDMPET